MKHKMLIMILAVNVSFSVAQNINFIPFEVEQLYIGMEWRDTVLLRPDAEILDMMPRPTTDLTPNPDIPKEGLTERLQEGIYERIIYSFEDGILVAMMFGGKIGRSTVFDREEVIRQIGKIYGDPYKIHLTGKEQEQGVISWQSSQLYINVMVPLEVKNKTSSIVGLQIMGRKYAEQINAIGSIADDGMSKKRQNSEDVELDAFVAKVKAILAKKEK